MTYALRQVQPLLTAPELELFKASRRNAIAHMTMEQLRSAVQRTRALRDKYRDLYRRQSVASETGRTAEGKTRRAHMGGENARTQAKSDIVADMLTRFQQRLDKLREGKAKTIMPVMDMASLREGVRSATKAAKPTPPQRTSATTGKAVASSTSATAQARGAVPADSEPASQRHNVLKQEPVNKKIHASARGRNKTYQAKKDNK